jgi:hypothetical protein
MSTPLEFVISFRSQLQADGIQGALTSGLACVHYGLQQGTKDSDWVFKAGDLTGLRVFLAKKEVALPPWRVSYRQICGAPLAAEYLRNGWSSHWGIWDAAGSREHHLDFFSAPPPVKEAVPDAEGWCSREVVAMMKKTDRAKDWPMVDGLGWQMALTGGGRAMVHIQDEFRLLALWRASSPLEKESAVARRPLLLRLDREHEPDGIFALVRTERAIWECVNQERYGAYQAAWKAFYRSWRAEEDWQWPTEEPFARQHERLTAAAANYDLPTDPIGRIGKANLLERALRRASIRSGTPPGRIAELCPPANELLP